MTSLALQKEVERKWQDFPAILRQRLRHWSFNLLVCALSELKNEGVLMSYQIIDLEDGVQVKAIPFRGYPKTVHVSFQQQSLVEC